jgi:phospholipid/cholesterol/gamma-HCH transport system ATP-binding protein
MPNHPDLALSTQTQTSILKIRGLAKSFGTQKVLSDLNFDLVEGQTTVVLGPSGCGKSVMLKHIIGLIRPDAGKIWFKDKRIDNLSERELKWARLQIGLLFQLSALFDSMTVRQNLEFPLDEHLDLSDAERRDKVAEALDMVDMLGSEQKLPAQLSGGQKKRVALARAIITKPSVILYDEPTTGLDPMRAKGIDELIVRLKDRLGVTSLVVTHDLVSARRVADHIVVMNEGNIVAEGSFEQLRESKNAFVARFFADAGSAAYAPGMNA